MLPGVPLQPIALRALSCHTLTAMLETTVEALDRIREGLRAKGESL
jgi:hypothetical protein